MNTHSVKRILHKSISNLGNDTSFAGNACAGNDLIPIGYEVGRRLVGREKDGDEETIGVRGPLRALLPARRKRPPALLKHVNWRRLGHGSRR